MENIERMADSDTGRIQVVMIYVVMDSVGGPAQRLCCGVLTAWQGHGQHPRNGMSQHLGAVQAVPVSTAREAHPYWQATVQNVPIQLQNHHLCGANLAYEEHHRHALRHFPNAGVTFHGDHKAGRVGVFTTDNIKYAAMDLFNVARAASEPLQAFCVARPQGNHFRQAQEAASGPFVAIQGSTQCISKEQDCTPGKIECLKDDIAICLQLSCFSTSVAKCQGVRCD